MKFGSWYKGGGKCFFSVWAPLKENVAVKIFSPQERLVNLSKDSKGCWQAEVDNVYPGTRYMYQINGVDNRPDPASHFQPEDVHGPSEVVDHNAFIWQDRGWKYLPLEEMVLYELHVGTFTLEGTFDAVIPRLDRLRELGVNTLSLLPVAQFPGSRNWGYDGAYLFGVQSSYGGPDGLKRLVNACHQRQMAVVLDVVYNHFGPEGNYLGEFCPYYTEKYVTPWGRANNFDDAYSSEAREFFCQNSLYWLEHYHIDGLRLDAVHAIYDMSAYPFLEELAARVEDLSKRLRKKHYLIAESNLNDTKHIRPRSVGGFGLDCQWLDDFHHSLRTLITGDLSGYYEDFGKIEHLAKSYREGFVYSGQYSKYRKRHHGNSSVARLGEQFVVFCQNHDQVGNRMLGERLSTLVSFEALKLTAAAYILSPFVPMLFMGEEYGEEAPFLYFISHMDKGLVEAVREGRKDEFKSFSWKGEPPDPQSEDTFKRSTLNWEKQFQGKHKTLWDFYKRLLELRRTMPALKHLDKENLEATAMPRERFITLRRWHGDSQILMLMNFNDAPLTLTVPVPEGTWKKLLDSSESSWIGPGGNEIPGILDTSTQITFGPFCCIVYEQVLPS